MPISIPSLARRAIGNIIDPEDITNIVDAVEILVDAFTSVEETVPGLVEDAIANDETVQEAIDTAIATEDIPGQVDSAVDIKVASLDLVEARDLLEEVNDDIVFGFAGDDNSRTWLEIAPSGGPTQNSLDLFNDVSPIPQPINSAVTGASYAVVGDDDSRTWLEVDPATGGPTEHALSLIAGGVTGGSSSIATWVVCSGDSMTGSGYPSYLQDLEPGWNVLNMGSGGETSTTIAGRMGGRPMLVTVSGSSIPTSGGVTVTLESDDAEHTPTPLLQQDGGTNPVRIAGVEGTLTESSGVYTFTRSLSGSALPVDWQVPLITRAMRDYVSGIHVMWWGTNDGGTGDQTAVIRRERALLEHITDPVPRYLVIAPTAGLGRQHADVYLQEFGRRFIDAHAYLMSDAAFVESGITRTGTDATDISANNVPTSFRSDSTHLNVPGYTMVARMVRDRIEEMGWL